MSSDDLHRLLADLPTTGTLLKVRPFRQVWRFEAAGKSYFLKFYPRNQGRLKRLVRGSPALREFLNLQAMQRGGIPSPRAVAQLSGFVIKGVKGDAVILQAIEPAEALDEYLNRLALEARPDPHHADLRRQIVEIVEKLIRAGLRHADLHLGNFLLSNGKLFLIDGYAIRRGAMRKKDLLFLGQSVSRFASRADLLRGWDALAAGPMPDKNPTARRFWRKSVESAFGANRYFGHLMLGDWRGHFFKHHKFFRRWSAASALDISSQDWQNAWPALIGQIESDRLEILKRSPSGDVLAAQIPLAGSPIDIIIKRPRRRKWYRHFNEIYRGGRARRAWRKAWSLVARDVPTAWPLLMVERRRFGRLVDSLIIFERIPGMLLPHVDLDSLDESPRIDLFFRLGRTLRLLERQGLHQYDSKTSNWMIRPDERLGPCPIVIDVDGIRKIVPPLWPIDRLLRSLREMPQYAPEDSRWVCIGYRPFARLLADSEPQAATDAPT